MDKNKQRFLNALADCNDECERIREQVNRYSDADNVTDGDHTQAVGLKNSLASIRKLFEAINAAPAGPAIHASPPESTGKALYL